MRELVASVCLAALTACGSVDTEQVDAPPDPIDAPVTDAAPIDAPACPIGTTAMCAGAELITCDGQGNITGTEACLLGCNATERRCNKLAPSNNLAAFYDEAEGATDLILVGAATIDTDSGTITDTGGARTPLTSTVTAGLPVGVFVIKVRSFTTGGLVTVQGTRALAIVSAGAVTIGHRLSVSARADINGPGALAIDANCRGGNAGAANANGHAGGGGGGFGTAGGRGGTGGSPTVQGGAAGGIAGVGELIPLRGGCPGGRSGPQPASYAAGGGGGAIQISSGTSIDIGAGGFVAANGGGGRGPSNPIFCIIDTPCGIGEGAGSGGAILLEAPSITVAATGGVVANGGGGSCGVTGSGSAGLFSAMPAPGQTCAGDTGSGGDGAAGATAAQPGGNGLNDDPVGGGGGGGLGRIRVNLPLGTTFTPAGVVSGASSAGALAVR